jgi:hypothetical protein
MPGFAPGARMVPHVWRAEVVQSAEIAVPIFKVVELLHHRLVVVWFHQA